MSNFLYNEFVMGDRDYYADPYREYEEDMIEEVYDDEDTELNIYDDSNEWYNVGE